jgi:hypothetical protein
MILIARNKMSFSEKIKILEEDYKNSVIHLLEQMDMVYDKLNEEERAWLNQNNEKEETKNR